jgi:hypothetical protein
MYHRVQMFIRNAPESFFRSLAANDLKRPFMVYI